MSVIRRIEIRNFRSIHHIVLEEGLLDLNTFVGSNDIGKSNVLRALNLFFNRETDLGVSLDFWEDFNKNIERKSGKGQYIRIILDIELKYENNKFVRWTKQWDNNGVLKKDLQEIFTNDWQPSNFIQNSRAKGWLDRIKYRYVPAIKSPEYFTHLFEELHDVLSYTYSEQFKKNTQSLISNIQTITKDITTELKDAISIENKISIPSDLKPFFGTLDFSFEQNGSKFHLKNRGDGIKIRHIPIVLKFLADKAKKYKRGALDVQTIWGFEEPENNLEMSQAFDMASKFLIYSNEIQIFVSTHSPAFYSLYKKSKTASCFLVERDGDDFTTIENVEKINVNLDERMGVLAYITPFIEQKNNELKREEQEKEKLKQKIDQLDSKTEILVFTEDSSDDLVMIKAILESNDFPADLTSVLSYGGKENLKSAYFATKLLIDEKFKSVKHVIFHRDRDIDGDEIINHFSSKFPPNYHLFITQNYDLDSYFLNVAHIEQLYPELKSINVQELIVHSMEATEGKSLRKLSDGLYQKDFKYGQIGFEHSPSKLMKQATQLYKNNPGRYCYGKTVLGNLIGKLQHKTKSHEFNLFQPSEYLKCNELQSIIRIIST